MKKTNKTFLGPLKSLCCDFIAWKKSGGLKYEAEYEMLRRIDKFLCNFIFPENTLPKHVVEEWCKKREYEHSRTHCSRVRVMKHFAKYMLLRGYDAYVTSLPSEMRGTRRFIAHIYTKDELKRIFSVIDNLDSKRYPTGHIQYPVLFRLYYSAGLRLSEGFNIKLKDVNFVDESIMIRNTKFGKERIVPLHHNMFIILQKLIEDSCYNNPETFIFSRNEKTQEPEKILGGFFMRTIKKAGIYHGGKNKGVRIHDFRHTFAVRSLQQAFLQGEDISNFLPYLSAYLGHADLRGSELYLQLTADVFPEITRRFSEKFSTIIPQEVLFNEDGK